jgi:hypothetical protein
VELFIAQSQETLRSWDFAQLVIIKSGAVLFIAQSQETLRSWLKTKLMCIKEKTPVMKKFSNPQL